MGDEDSGYSGEKPASGLLRVVWFRQMLHRWQSSSTAAAAIGSSASASDTAEAARGTSTDKQGNINGETTAEEDDDDSRKPLPPAARLPRLVVVEESSPSPMTPVEPPSDVPRGCCAVYVGAERRRFVVPTAYLGAPVFARLLEKAEEEFGFDYHGAGITIPCDTEAFKYILVVVEAHRQGLVHDEGNPKVREEGEASETR